jgi:hypothetical protein
MRILLLAAATMACLQAQPRIVVSNVNQLYAAVNNAGNAGATVHLAAGVYTLNSSLSPATSGRIVLQPGMNLEGETVLVDVDGDGWPDTAANQSVVDGSTISGASRIAIVEAGRQNRVEALTVVGSGRLQAVGSGIGTSMVPAEEEIGLTVRGCLIVGTGRRGIQVIRLGPAGAAGGRAHVERNVIQNVGTMTGSAVGHGIQVVVAGLVNGASLFADVRGNHVIGSKTGLSLERNPGPSSAPGSASLDVNSSMNLFEADYTGIQMALVAGGRDSVTFQSVQDRLIGNQGIGGFGLGLFGTASDTIRVSLLNTTFRNNGPVDFIVGLDANGLAGPHSTGNSIDLLVRGISAAGTPGSFVANPGSPQYDNHIRSIGSEVALQASNDSVPIAFDPDGD